MTQLRPCQHNIKKARRQKNNIHKTSPHCILFPPAADFHSVHPDGIPPSLCVCARLLSLLVCGFCSVTVFHCSNFVPLTELPREGYEALGFCAKGMPVLLPVENKACRFALLPPDAILLQEKRAALGCTGLSRD